ncbi:MAG TPA: amidohydrolase family protein [Streptosporangiaceae bacterium]|nr:amidohydrolase family protein [Streptosporangiaceae bacterium]
MYIDVHNHVIPDAVLHLGEQDSRLGISASDGMFRSPHHVPFPLLPAFHSPQEKVADLAGRGLWGAVISPAPVLFGYDLATDVAVALCEASNQGMAEFCAHAPDRLHWLANLPMQAPTVAAGMYADAVAASAVGAAIGTSIAGRRLDEGDFEVFWAQADAIARPVLIHPAFNCSHPALGQWYLQNAIGNPLETTIVVERLICAGVLARHPRVRLLLMHGGGFLPYQLGRLVHARSVRPELADAPVDAWEFLGQLYFDTITHDTLALRYLVERVGLDHVVLGTDLPFDMALATPLATLAAALTEAQVEAVAVTNPRRLFGLG